VRKIFTFTYIIEAYQNNEQKEEFLSEEIFTDFNDEIYEPAPESIEAILNFAKYYEVLGVKGTGNIGPNLN
jgi:hypothetical protein